MTSEQRAQFLALLKPIGLPGTFDGDRLDAFKAGVVAVLDAFDTVFPPAKDAKVPPEKPDSAKE